MIGLLPSGFSREPDSVTTIGVSPYTAGLTRLLKGKRGSRKCGACPRMVSANRVLCKACYERGMKLVAERPELLTPVGERREEEQQTESAEAPAQV